MAEGTKVRNWSYPFPVKSAADMSSTSTNESQIYQVALAKAKSGHYPIGRNGLWHGGIHFDEGTAELLDQTSVRCIADGEVIAYRIDGKEGDSYPESNFSTGNKKYSTGFVLVRHCLEVPKPPLATAGTAAEPAAEAQPKLTFYSLYMHLLDWASYKTEGGPALPPFLGETVYSVKPEKAVDPVLGLRVRAGPGTGSDIKALLPKGARVRLGEKTAATGEWRKLLSILEGSALPSLDLDENCWVYSKELESTSMEDEFLVGERANDKETELAPGKGLNVRKTGNGHSDDPKTGLVPVGATFTLKPGSGNYRELESFVSGQGISPLTPTSVKNISGFVYLPYLQTSRVNPDLGEVITLRSPYRISAGEIVGHPGCYQNHDDATASPMVHLEVFCWEDPTEFIAKSRNAAIGLPKEQKTLLKIYKGASKLITHRPDISASNPPKLTDEGVVIGVDLTLDQNLLDGLPAERKITVSETLPGSATPKITYWWRLDGLFADASGNLIGGWLCEQPEITTRHSPWEWEGFETISEGACNADFLACHLDATDTLEESERTDYAARIDLADTGPVRGRLYDIIDGADGSTRDGKLTPEEIKSALAKPWHAQSIARIITHYESEWFWNPEKWDEIDTLLSLDSELNMDWLEEKNRIKSLSWWKESSLLSIAPQIWHIQPTVLIMTFGTLDLENSLQWLKVPSGQLTFDVEGNDIEDPSHPLHKYFSRVAHWPGGASGVTIGRGYDLGQRPHPEQDLAATKISEPLYSWLLGAKGLKGETAKNYLNSATPDIRKIKISRKQQYDLFNKVYDFMKSEVIRISGSNSNVVSYGTLNWETTHKKIQDIAVDLIYRGDYTSSSRETVQQHIVNNDLNRLRTTMADQSKWPAVPEDRFNRRAAYLEFP